MIPSNFDYVRPKTIEDAQREIASARPKTDVALLAGGQSLLTALKQRTLLPSLIVDLAEIETFREPVKQTGNRIRIPAMIRQTDFVEDQLVGRCTPLFKLVAKVAADPMLRRQGTVVGAFCEADPFGDWVPAGLVHNASLEVAMPRGLTSRLSGFFSKGGARVRHRALSCVASLPKRDRFRRGEIACAALVEPMPVGAKYTYRKAKHAAIGWSIASIAAIAVVKDGDVISEIRLASSGALTAPVRLLQLEKSLKGVRLSDKRNIALRVDEQLEALSFVGDRYASDRYRAKRLRVEIKRALAEFEN